MSWRDTYRQGSFRGASFRTVDAERSGGQRGVLHEFLQRDLPWFEDLGRAPGRITINCWVAGDDYWAARDALIDACNQPGPGTLVFPFKGEMTVADVTWTCSESAVDGGIADFSISFSETSGTPIGMTVAPATGNTAKAAANDALAKAPSRFAARFDVGGLPAFVEQAGFELVNGVALLTRIAASPLGGAGSLLRNFDAALRLLPASARALVRQPLALAQSVVGLVSALSALAPSPRHRAAAMRVLTGFGADVKPVIGSTPPRIAQARNQAAFTGLVTLVGAAGLVDALSDTEFASYDEAVAARSDMAARIDALMLTAGDAGDDAALSLLSALRTASSRDLTVRGGTLARIYRFTPKATEPALVIARRLYDRTLDIEARADDLVARNRVRHPGFVPGGTGIDVLQEVAA